MKMPLTPFENSRHIGTICQISATIAKVNLPWAAALSPRYESGHRIGTGEVGEFIFIEAERYAVFGRITDVKLPEKERLEVEGQLKKQYDVHPVGTIQLLNVIDLSSSKIRSGIPHYPRLGAKVFSAHPNLVGWLIANENSSSFPCIDLATLAIADDVTISIKPEYLFGRHCAILGSTGGGKSFTIAKIIESIQKLNGKCIILDSTGEFKSQQDGIKHYSIGGNIRSHEEVVFSYRKLTETDLFTLCMPSVGIQAPKLREAIKTLKLLNIKPELGVNGIYKKFNKSKESYESALIEHTKIIENPDCDFDITKLIQQIQNECVYPSANYGKDHTKWGDQNEAQYSQCVPLIARIEGMLSSSSLSCFFDIANKKSLTSAIDEFHDGSDNIFRLSMEYLPFEYNARELLANVLGRHLLTLARKGKYKDMPLVVLLDEAHQFLNKHIGDEYNRIYLDAFGVIAKEGRKYGLTSIIATQRPRDIPQDVLSQMGTLIVHRLTNERDREVVESACGDIDKSAVSFLPTLGQGEALMIGVDFPIPLSIKINKPLYEPYSDGPDYSNWKAKGSPIK